MGSSGARDRPGSSGAMVPAPARGAWAVECRSNAGPPCLIGSGGGSSPGPGYRARRRLRVRLRLRPTLREERLRGRPRLARPPVLAIPPRRAAGLGVGDPRAGEPGRAARAAAAPPRRTPWAGWLLRGEREHLLRRAPVHLRLARVPDRLHLSLIHISEPTRLGMISYA